MDELINKMQTVFSNTVILYMKAHKFHFQVRGSDFFANHKFFEHIYSEVYGAVDGVGEEIRAIQGYVPYSPAELAQHSTLVERPLPGTTREMVLELFNDNSTTLTAIMDAYKAADKFNEIGLSNFLQDRYDAHKKLQYFLRSTLQGEDE